LGGGGGGGGALSEGGGGAATEIETGAGVLLPPATQIII
jgi:hypothetical protein